MKKSTRPPDLRRFKALRSRLSRLEQRYNPSDENLHFVALAHGDADLYPAILALTKRGLSLVHQHRAFFSKHSLYADGGFWYGLFVFISAAAGRIRRDHAQAYVPRDVVDALTLILARMTRYSSVNGGDITNRNSEALENTLLAFYDEKSIRSLRTRSKGDWIAIKWSLDRLVEVWESERSDAVAVGGTRVTNSS